jgi:hypothetical protein
MGLSGPLGRWAGNIPAKKGLFFPAAIVLVFPPSIPMKALLITLSLLLTVSLHAQSTTGQPTGQTTTGQSTPTDTVTQDGLWDARLKGGNYIVRCNSIIALSKHEYISDGVARVVEVNITLNSAQIVRFYFLEPYKPESGSGTVGAGTQALDKAKALYEQAAGRISPDLAAPKVVKNYPTSTHAHTIEFVLKDEALLNSLFGSLERSFRTGQGRVWKEPVATGAAPTQQ